MNNLHLLRYAGRREWLLIFDKHRCFLEMQFCNTSLMQEQTNCSWKANIKQTCRLTTSKRLPVRRMRLCLHCLILHILQRSVSRIRPSCVSYNGPSSHCPGGEPISSGSNGCCARVIDQKGSLFASVIFQSWVRVPGSILNLTTRKFGNEICAWRSLLRNDFLGRERKFED